jgi:hypothetical protein
MSTRRQMTMPDPSLEPVDHWWRPMEIVYATLDDGTQRTVEVTYWCSACRAGYVGTGDGLTPQQIWAADPGPLDFWDIDRAAVDAARAAGDCARVQSYRLQSRKETRR